MLREMLRETPIGRDNGNSILNLALIYFNVTLSEHGKCI